MGSIEGGCRGNPGRDPGILPRQDSVLQDSGGYNLCDRVSDDGDQESAEIPDSGAGNPRTRPRRGGAYAHGVAIRAAICRPTVRPLSDARTPGTMKVNDP